MTSSRSKFARFETFVSEAELVLAERSRLPVEQFEALVNDAEPLVLDRGRRQLVDLFSVIGVLTPWWVRYDFIETLGLLHDEDSYTELLAWMLRVETHPETALVRQQSCMRHLCPSINLQTPIIDVRTQVLTRDGIPDLMLAHEDFVLIIEAKTGSAEHETPSRSMQTVSYPIAIKELLGRPAQPHVAFLTLDRSDAANKTATRLCWFDGAFALAQNLNPNQFDEHLRILFGLAISHFVRCGLTRSATDLLERLIANKECLNESGDILRNLTAIQELHDLFSRDKK